MTHVFCVLLDCHAALPRCRWSYTNFQCNYNERSMWKLNR